MPKIYETSAWKALNFIIDDKIATLQRATIVVMELCKTNSEPVPYKRSDVVINRVTFDEGGSDDFALNVSLRDLDWLAEQIENLSKLKDEISDLQRYKLSLANDWDYTKGNDRMKREVLGDRKFEGIEESPRD